MPENRTLLFGEGLFETIRWHPGEEKLRLHYERLSNSAKALGIAYPSYEEFLGDLQRVAEGKGELYVKYLLLSFGEDYYGGKPTSYKSLVFAKPLKPSPERVSLCLSSYQRHSSDPVCRHKTTSYLFNVLVKRSARERGFYDGLVLNERGFLCETSSANLLLVKGSRLYTPAKDCGLLWGTTLELLSRKMQVLEEYIKPSHLEGADGVFILNSLLLCVPVERLEDKVLRIDLEAFKEVKKALLL
ncbi:MAG: aminodeoxychorismate lyase [Aquificota bacterium]|nr:MAG: aminodeoxychorismate lyase [Aquificota bacterium]